MDTLRWQAGTLFLLDQTKLPFEEIYLPCHSWQDVRQAISVLAVRGAPAIGVAAAYAVVLAARSLCQKGGDTPFLTALEAICQDLDAARPTAVNLHWALTQMMVCARQHEADGAEAVTAVLEEKAIAIHEADVAINTAKARFGADELEKLGRPRLPRQGVVRTAHHRAEPHEGRARDSYGDSGSLTRTFVSIGIRRSIAAPLTYGQPTGLPA